MKFLLATILVTAVVAGTSQAVTVKNQEPAGTLTVQPLPAQPDLKVVDGTSIVNTDGSVNWQPAGNSKLQNTFNPQR